MGLDAAGRGAPAPALRVHAEGAWGRGEGPPAPGHRAALALLLVALLAAAPPAARAGDRRLLDIAREAREAVAVIDWFYVRQGACPLPSRPAELRALQSELGDGYSVELQGRFAAIGGISMAQKWLYYAAPEHPDRCTLWRRLGWDPALIWRRHRAGGDWAYDPGDGSLEQPIRIDLAWPAH